MLRNFSLVSGPRSRHQLRRLAAGAVAAAALGAPASSLLGAGPATASGGAFLEVAPTNAAVPPPSAGHDNAAELRCAVASPASRAITFVPPPVSCL